MMAKDLMEHYDFFNPIIMNFALSKALGKAKTNKANRILVDKIPQKSIIYLKGHLVQALMLLISNISYLYSIIYSLLLSEHVCSCLVRKFPTRTECSC